MFAGGGNGADGIGRDGRSGAACFDPTQYVEMTNQDLRDGDILPGSGFQMGNPATFGRELLKINFRADSRAHEIIAGARIIGERGRRAGRDVLGMVTDIARLVQQGFHPGQGQAAYMPGADQTVGHFVSSGGCCRHRSAAMQMALQAAGIPSRYVRVDLIDGQAHAIVQVDVKGNRSYDYVVDLNAGNSGWMSHINRMEDGRVLFAVNGVGYAMDSKRMNVIWRPIGRMAPSVLLGDRELPRLSLSIGLEEAIDEALSVAREQTTVVREPSLFPWIDAMHHSPHRELIDEHVGAYGDGQVLLAMRRIHEQLKGFEPFEALNVAQKASLVRTVARDPSYHDQSKHGNEVPDEVVRSAFAVHGQDVPKERLLPTLIVRREPQDAAEAQALEAYQKNLAERIRFRSFFSEGGHPALRSPLVQAGLAEIMLHSWQTMFTPIQRDTIFRFFQSVNVAVDGILPHHNMIRSAEGLPPLVTPYRHGIPHAQQGKQGGLSPLPNIWLDTQLALHFNDARMQEDIASWEFFDAARKVALEHLSTEESFERHEREVMANIFANGLLNDPKLREQCVLEDGSLDREGLQGALREVVQVYEREMSSREFSAHEEHGVLDDGPITERPSERARFAERWKMLIERIRARREIHEARRERVR